MITYLAKPFRSKDQSAGRRTKAFGWLPATALALAVALAAQSGSAQPAPLEWSELRVLVEINATDGDAGFQAKMDAVGWKEVRIVDPDGRKIYKVQATGSVREQGLTENFFESAEPSCEDDPLADFLARFPAGVYLFTGKTTDGDKLEGEAELSHALPGAPENLAPDAVGGENPANLTISWAPGGGLGNCPPLGVVIDPPGGVALFGFMVVVEREVPEPLTVFTVELPADATSVTIPAEFLEASGIYKYEVIAIEDRDGERGNQTISETFFCTAPIATIDCELPE